MSMQLLEQCGSKYTVKSIFQLFLGTVKSKSGQRICKKVRKSTKSRKIWKGYSSGCLNTTEQVDVKIWAAFCAKKQLLHALLVCWKAKNRFFCWIAGQCWGGQLVLSWPLQELANGLKCSTEYVQCCLHVFWLLFIGRSNTLTSRKSISPIINAYFDFSTMFTGHGKWCTKEYRSWYSTRL